MYQDIAKSQIEDADHDPRAESHAKFFCISEAGRKLRKFTTFQASAHALTSMLFVGSGGQ